MDKIILDCERMKYPYTGLHHFCKELGEGLISQGMRGDMLTFYTPEKYKGFFGPEYQYLVHKISDKFFKTRLSHCRLWHCTYQGSSYLPLKRRGLKLLATIHDLNFLHERKTNAKKKKYMARTQQLVDKADGLVAISHFVKTEMEQHLNLGGKPVTVIYNGGANIPGELKKPPGDFSTPFFFSVGTIASKKNFHVLTALLKNNDHHLIIAGVNQDEHYRREILSNAAKQGVANRVRLIGPVAETEKYWLIKNSVLFCFPSVAEGYGLPVVEAMQMGKQVLLSKHTSLPEIGGPHALYLDSFDPDYISSVAAKYLQQVNETNGKSQELINWARQFNWADTARQYKELYKEIL